MDKDSDLLKEIIEETKKRDNLNVKPSFETAGGFALLQRQAECLARSGLLPSVYIGNLSNIMIALELSSRLKISPIAAMQSLHIIQGRPSWASTFIIAQINSSNKFKGGLRFEYSGKKGEKSRACYAYITDKSGEVIEGPEASIQMAYDEGWYTKKDKKGKSCSKWPTMPELMLAYRSAAFFGRIYASDLILGMQSVEEVEDVGNTNNTENRVPLDIESLKTEQVDNEEKQPEPQPEPAHEPAEEQSAEDAMRNAAG